MKLAALHCHSEFSARDSLIRIGELPEIAKAQGWDAVTLTDHGGIDGAYRFVKACRETGIKPIVGTELYVEGVKGERYNHLTVLAKNSKGFSNIAALISHANRNHYDAKRRRAFVTLDEIIEYLDDCIIMSGCAGSIFWRAQGDANADLRRAVEHFGENFFFEVQPLYDMDDQHRVNRMAASAAREWNIPVVVGSDCHFAPGEQHFHEALLAVLSRAEVGSDKAWTFSTKLNYIMTPEETVEALAKSGLTKKEAMSAVQNTAKIFDIVEEFDWNDFPKARLPKICDDPDKALRDAANAGLKAAGLADKPEYAERLKEELDVFCEAGLSPYLILVDDIIKFFKEEGAVIGPRGSVGGSLVAYCIGVAKLDPIKYGLSYQRFYAPGRRGWPDVDVDVDDDFRQRVPELLQMRFGEDNVAQISNIINYKARTAINDAAIAYGVDLDHVYSDYEQVKIAEESGKLEDYPTGQHLKAMSPKGFEFAQKLVNRVKTFGAHAGGFVISADPIIYGRSCVVRRGKGSCLVWNMEDSDELDFIKFDFLGLDSLKAIHAIEEATGANLDDADIHDQDVYTDLSEGRCGAVPQFKTSGMRAFLSLLQPTKIEDLIWANAAFRPGGLGQMKPDEMVKTYRDDPDEIIIYQEEVMQLCAALAGFSWMEADAVRKVIAKSKGTKALDEFRGKFVEGCREQQTLDDEDANDLWSTILEFGRYSFNKCLHPLTPVLRIHDDGTLEAKEIGMVNPGEYLLGPDGSRRLVKDKMVSERASFEVLLDSGESVCCSADHRFVTERGVAEPLHEIINRNGSIAVETGIECPGMGLSGLRKEVHGKEPQKRTSERVPEVSGSAQTRAVRDDAQELGKSGASRAHACCQQKAEAADPGRASRPCGCGGAIPKMEGGESGEGSGEHAENVGCAQGVKANNFEAGRRIRPACPACCAAQILPAGWKELRGGFSGILDFYNRSGRPSSLSADLRCTPLRTDSPPRCKFREGDSEVGDNQARADRDRLLHDERKDSSADVTRDRGFAERYDLRHRALRKIVAVSNRGVEHLIDIEVDEDHLFMLANGIISHNSHAAAYAWNAYRIAWAKRAHPIQSYCALLQLEQAKGKKKVENEITFLLDEIEELGIPLIPPNVNKSALDWEIVEDGGKQAIATPLTEIPGMKTVTAKGIYKRRMGQIKTDNGGPFADKEDLKKRLGKMKYPEGLIEAAFGERMTLGGGIRPTRGCFENAFLHQIKTCVDCEISNTCKKPTLPERGETNILIVGEAPGREEERAGRPFVGPSGKLMLAILNRYGIKREDVSWTNAVHCRPEGSDYPTDCPFVFDEIARLEPPLILAVGRRAFHKLGGDRGITKANGRVFEFPDLPPVVASVHPAYVLRNDSALPEIERALRKFAKMALRLMGKENVKNSEKKSGNAENTID